MERPNPFSRLLAILQGLRPHAEPDFASLSDEILDDLGLTRAEAVALDGRARRGAPGAAGPRQAAVRRAQVLTLRLPERISGQGRTACCGAAPMEP